jgi:hypothetical protein
MCQRVAFRNHFSVFVPRFRTNNHDNSLRQEDSLLLCSLYIQHLTCHADISNQIVARTMSDVVHNNGSACVCQLQKKTCLDNKYNFANELWT